MPCNRLRASQVMSQHGLEALVTSSQANLTYLLDYPTMSSCMSEATVFAVLPRDMQAGLGVIASRNSAAIVAEWAPQVTDVCLWGTYHVELPPDVSLEALAGLPRRHAILLREAKSVETASDGLRECLKTRGLLSGSIGFDEKGLPSPVIYNRVKKALPGIAEGYRQILLEDPVFSGRTGGADTRYLIKYGQTPTVIFGPGRTSEMHAVDEFVPIPNLIHATQILALTIADWCGIGA